MIDFDQYETELYSPNFLFHYTTYETGLTRIIQEKRLKFSTGKNSQDPMESDEFTHVGIFSNLKSNLDSNPEREELARVINGYNKLGDEINKLRGQVKFACFCIDRESPQSMPWDKAAFRSRMWSQYADKHKGLCLVFDKAELITTISAKKDAGLPDMPICKNVIYKNETERMDLLLHEGDLLKSASTLLSESIDSYIFTKLKDYENESEFRIAYHSGDNQEFELIDTGNSLCGVLLGHSIEWKQIRQIASHLEQSNIPCKSVHWLKGMPSFFPV